jgi:ankyrin repeat protein
MNDAAVRQSLLQYTRALRSGDAALALTCIEAIPADRRHAALNDGALLRFDHKPPLIEAARAGATELIKTLLAFGAAVEGTSESGETALFAACAKQQWSSAQALLDAGANSATPNKHGTRLADVALAKQGGLEWAQRWLGERPALDYANAAGNTPLHFAARSGDAQAVRWVMAHASTRATTRNKEGVRPLDQATSLAAFQALHDTAPDAPLCITFKDEDCALHRMAAAAETPLLAHVLAGCAALGFAVSSPGKIRNTPLHHAAGDNRVENAALLLKAGAKINARNTYNYAPLHWAAEQGHLEMIHCLIRHGAELSPKTSTEFIIKEFRTPLYFAADKGHLACAQALLEAGADPNIVCDTSCGTPLTTACQGDDLPMIECLLAHRASPNGVARGSDDFYYFPLSSARSAVAIERLIAAGADVNARNSQHQSALHVLAGYLGNDADALDVERIEAAVRALLAHGANVDAPDMHGRTALSNSSHPAITAAIVAARVAPAPVAALSAKEAERQSAQNSYRRGIATLVEWMTGRTAKPATAPAEAGATPFGVELYNLAHDSGDNVTLRSLLVIAQQASRADVRYINPDDYDNNETALYRILHALQHSDYRKEPLDWDLALLLVQTLVDKGADVNAVETLWQNTPLHAAVITTASGYTRRTDIDGAWRIVESLLNAGANAAVENEDGATAIDFARDSKVVAGMVKRGCRHGRCHSALHSAAEYSQSAVVVTRLLALHPAGLNSQDKDGKTPLMKAVEQNNAVCARALVEAGADFARCDSSGLNVFANGAMVLAADALQVVMDALGDRGAELSEAINAQDSNGVTALAYALSAEPNLEPAEIRTRQHSLALAFIARGARVDIQDHEGSAMLDYAPTKKLRAVVEKAAKAQR